MCLHEANHNNAFIFEMCCVGITCINSTASLTAAEIQLETQPFYYDSMFNFNAHYFSVTSQAEVLQVGGNVSFNSTVFSTRSPNLTTNSEISQLVLRKSRLFIFKFVRYWTLRESKKRRSKSLCGTVKTHGYPVIFKMGSFPSS